jgi:CRP-like cAMP-binding protein
MNNSTSSTSTVKDLARKFGRSSGSSDDTIGNHHDAIDSMLSPVPNVRKVVISPAVGTLSERFRTIGMGNDSSSASLDFSKSELEMHEILVQRGGTVKLITGRLNEQIAANEAAFKKTLEERNEKKRRYRNQKKKRRKHKLPKGKSQQYQVLTESVWMNQRAITSFHIDPKTYQAPNKLNQPSIDQENMIRRIMKENVLMKDGPGPQQVALLHAFEPIEVRKGQELNHDDIEDYFYIVQEGEVEIKHKDKVLAKANHGDTFGDMNLVYRKDGEKQHHTLVAKEDAKLLRLKQEDFRGIVQYQAKLEDIDKQDMLKKLPFMNKLLLARDQDEKNKKERTDAIDRISSVMKPLYFSQGDELYNEEDETMYVIKEGNVMLTSVKDQQFVLGPGDYIGRQVLMGSRGKEPEVRSLKALSSGMAYVIPKSVAEKVLGANYVNRQTSRLDDPMKLDNFQCIKSINLDPKTLSALAESVDDKTFQPGSIIMKQGSQVEPCLFLIREGYVTLSSDDGTFVREVGPGGYFGVEKLLIPKNVTGQKAKPSKDMKLPAQWNVKVNAMPCIAGVLSLLDSQEILDNDGKKMEKPLVSNADSNVIAKRKQTGKLVRSTVSLDNLEMVSVLGEGAFGKVWLVQTELNGRKEKFALKTIEKEKELIDAFNREVTFLSSFGLHPFIVDLIKVFDRDDNMYMMLSYASGGELWDIVHREDADGNWNSGIPEIQARFYTFLLADTLAYIHSKKYVYRDLKMENILIDSDGYPVLIDFGFSKYCPEKTVSKVCMIE